MYNFHANDRLVWLFYPSRL